MFLSHLASVECTRENAVSLALTLRLTLYCFTALFTQLASCSTNFSAISSSLWSRIAIEMRKESIEAKNASQFLMSVVGEA